MPYSSMPEERRRRLAAAFGRAYRERWIMDGKKGARTDAAARAQEGSGRDPIRFYNALPAWARDTALPVLGGGLMFVAFVMAPFYVAACAMGGM